MKLNAMNVLIQLVLILTIGVILSSCASTPKPGQKGYTTHTHYDNPDYGWHSSYR